MSAVDFVYILLAFLIVAFYFAQYFQPYFCFALSAVDFHVVAQTVQRFVTML